MSTRQDPVTAPPIAEQLARRIHAAMAGLAPAPDVVHATERLLLDSLACALGASRSPAIRFPPDRPSRVTIELADGRRLVRELPYPKGDYRDPFTDQEIAAKFTALSAGVLSPAQQGRAIDCALGFSRRSVPELLAACVASGAA